MRTSHETCMFQIARGSRSMEGFGYMNETVTETTKGSKLLIDRSNTSSLLPPETSVHLISYIIEIYLIPVLCLFGIIGNTLATVVFLRKTLRNNSCSVFLAARGLSDNGFLSTLLIIWLSRIFQLQLGTLHSACRIIIFLSYVCGCISVWLVVFITAENFIRICKPFIVNRVCTPNIARVAVCLLCVTTVSIYNFPFWAMSPDQCQPFLEFYDTVQAMIYTDTVLTLVLPLLCIIVLMAAIVCDLIKSYKRRDLLRAPLARRAKNPMAQITKMLFAVTISFFCLNLPSHVNRLRLMIQALIDPRPGPGNSSMDNAVQHITLLIYYISLSMNIVVYLAFGSRFRKVFLRMFCSRCISTPLTDNLASANNNSKTRGLLVPLTLEMKDDGRVECQVAQSTMTTDC